MCMISVGNKEAKLKALKQGKKNLNLINLEFILDANVQNPDGFGYYAGNSKTSNYEIEKFYCSDEKGITDAIEHFNKNGRNYKFVIGHSRGATSGYKGTSQMHPIPICHLDIDGKNVYQGGFIIHNGVLRDSTDEISDTQIAGYKLGQGMWERNITSIKGLKEPKFFKFLENEYSGSRVIVVHKDEYVIFNEDTGFSDKGGNGTSGKLRKVVSYYDPNLEDGAQYDEKFMNYGVSPHYGDPNYKWDNEKLDYVKKEGDNFIPDFDPNNRH